MEGAGGPDGEQRRPLNPRACEAPHASFCLIHPTSGHIKRGGGEKSPNSWDTGEIHGLLPLPRVKRLSEKRMSRSKVKPPVFELLTVDSGFIFVEGNS